MRYSDIITEVERQSKHKKMKVVVYKVDNFTKEMQYNKRNDPKIISAVATAIRDITKYYSFKGSLKGRFKASGDSGKSKNLTQIDNNVYHYHIGPDYKEHRKDADLVSNNVIEFQVFETFEVNKNTGNKKPILAIIFFSITTHGKGRWNINDIVDITDIEDTDDLEKVATRL